MEKFKNQEWYDFEREKTPEEIAVFEQINTHMRDFVERFGGTYKPVTIDNIHIMDPQKIRHEIWNRIKGTDGILHGGEFLSEVQSVFIMGPSIQNADLLAYANSYTHELLHLQSFNSFDVYVDEADQDSAVLQKRRVGFTVYSHKDEEYVRYFFNDVNEAMTQELTRRFAQEFFPNIPELKDDITSHKNLFPHLTEVDQMTETTIRTRKIRKRGLYERRSKKHTVYAQERQQLHNAITEIYRKNAERFANESDVFDMFAQSYFSGNLLHVARLIRKTFGKDALRTLAHQTKKDISKKKYPPYTLELNEE